MKILLKATQKVAKELSSGSTIKKLISQIDTNNLSFNGIQNLGIQKTFLVNKMIKSKTDFSSILCDLKKESTSIEPFKIVLNGKEILLEAYKGTQKGTNVGFFASNPQNSRLYYVKMGGEQSIIEAFSSKLYKLTGANVPQMSLFKDEAGKVGLLSEYIPNLEAITTPNKQVCSDFGADVWLANWDAVCSKNLQTDGIKQYRIDLGGTLNYRAQGGKKTFDCVPSELTTLINPNINKDSEFIFSKMTREDIINSLKKVVNCRDKDIIKIAEEYNYPCTKEMTRTLIKRKEFLQYALELIEKRPLEGQTLLEYLTKIQDDVLNTPLWEFKSYKGEIKKQRKNISEKLKELIPQKEQNKETLIKKLEKQRRKIKFKDDVYSLDEFLAYNVKDSSGMNANTYIRYGEESPLINQLDAIMNQTNLPEMVVYRGAHKGDFCSPSDLTLDEFLDTIFKEGECFNLPIFANTSLNKKVAEKFAGNNRDKFIWKFNVSKGTKGIWMENLNAGAQQIKDNCEDEVLLQRNLPCRFKNRIPYFTHDLIEVDVLRNKTKA